MRTSLEVSNPWHRSRSRAASLVRGGHHAADPIIARFVLQGLRTDTSPQYVWGTSGMGKTHTSRYVVKQLLREYGRQQVWLAEASGLAYRDASLDAICDTVLALTSAEPVYLVVDDAHYLPDFDVLPGSVASGLVRLAVTTIIRPLRGAGPTHTLWHGPPVDDAPSEGGIAATIADGVEPPHAWWSTYRRLGGHPPGAGFSPHGIDRLFRARRLPYHRVPASGAAPRGYPAMPEALLRALASRPGGVLSNRPVPSVTSGRRYYYDSVLPACEVGILAQIRRFGAHGPHETIGSVWFRSVLARNWAGGHIDTGPTSAVAAMLALADRAGGEVRHWMTRSVPAGTSSIRVPLLYYGLRSEEQAAIVFPTDNTDAVVRSFRQEVDATGGRWPCYVRTPAQLAYAAARCLEAATHPPTTTPTAANG